MINSGLSRVRELAKKDKSVKFTALLHHITPELLEESFYLLKRGASPGVDGVMRADYQENLTGNLKELHERLQKGSYRALPAKRVYIPKADGRKRPPGIVAAEDKIAQHAVSRVLAAIYEEDFLGFSYGFRPGRGCHDALDALAVAIGRKKVNWILEADITGFFDSISHDVLFAFMESRIADHRRLRLIKKWLKAGVVEEGNWQAVDRGTPQGGLYPRCWLTCFCTMRLTGGWSNGAQNVPKET
jgi:group II intron reverse transcriptase/maturase